MVYSVYANNNVPRFGNLSNPNVNVTAKNVSNRAAQTVKEMPTDSFASTTKSAVGSLALFNGIPFLSFLFKNKKVTGKFINPEIAKLSKYNKDAFKAIFKKGGKLSDKIANFFRVTGNTQEQYSTIKSAVKKVAKATKKGEVVTDAMKAATKAKPIAKAAVETGKKGALKKFGGMLKNSGALFMLALSGIIEGVTEVYPTFKELGTEKGLKQLGKSSIKVVGDTVGYIGAAKIGSAIGSIISPGVGTALGFVAGFIGSYAAGKVTKAITGKSEREIAKEQEAKQNMRPNVPVRQFYGTV